MENAIAKISSPVRTVESVRSKNSKRIFSCAQPKIKNPNQALLLAIARALQVPMGRLGVLVTPVRLILGNVQQEIHSALPARRIPTVAARQLCRIGRTASAKRATLAQMEVHVIRFLRILTRLQPVATKTQPNRVRQIQGLCSGRRVQMCWTVCVNLGIKGPTVAHVSSAPRSHGNRAGAMQPVRANAPHSLKHLGAMARVAIRDAYRLGNACARKATRDSGVYLSRHSTLRVRLVRPV